MEKHRCHDAGTHPSKLLKHAEEEMSEEKRREACTQIRRQRRIPRHPLPPLPTDPDRHAPCVHPRPPAGSDEKNATCLPASLHPVRLRCRMRQTQREAGCGASDPASGKEKAPATEGRDAAMSMSHGDGAIKVGMGRSQERRGMQAGKGNVPVRTCTSPSCRAYGSCPIRWVVCQSLSSDRTAAAGWASVFAHARLCREIARQVHDAPATREVRNGIGIGALPQPPKRTSCYERQRRTRSYLRLVSPV